MSGCIFCDPEEERVFLSSDLAYALWDSYPVTPRHALVIPRRHAPDYFALARRRARPTSTLAYSSSATPLSTSSSWAACCVH